MHVTLETIRDAVDRCAVKWGLTEVEQSFFENAATVFRDALCDMGLDPSERTVQESCLVASYFSLSYLDQCVAVVGPAIPHTLIQATILRMWLEGELPVLSLQEVIALKAMEAMYAPIKCTYIHTFDNGAAQPCIMDSHTEGNHRVHQIEYDADSGGMAVREIEVEITG